MRGGYEEWGGRVIWMGILRAGFFANVSFLMLRTSTSTML